jgi:branched-chain amino acid aminotransferase/4-amino-4-deoxychorismate lyase
VNVRRNEGSPTSRVKSLAYLDNVLARAEAKAMGADEALMLNNRGDVACAAAANLFWVHDEALFTPALECGVLAGVARMKVIEAAQSLGIPVHQTAVGVETVREAAGLFLTNSLLGLRPVGLLDGRSIPQSAVATRLTHQIGV